MMVGTYSAETVKMVEKIKYNKNRPDTLVCFCVLGLCFSHKVTKRDRMMNMIIFTSLIAIAVVLLPIPKLVLFHPRHYFISIIVYWLFDLIKGICVTVLAYLIAGWIAAYFAAVLAVVTTFFYLRCNTFAIATGATLVLSPVLILIGIIVFAISLFVTRYYFFSTYLTVAAVIILGLVFAAHLAVWATIVCLGIMVCVKHRKHFQRFKSGIEKQLEW
jgi:acyl phosphate:glycerol-3-phosphate acyltransferase